MCPRDLFSNLFGWPGIDTERLRFRKLMNEWIRVCENQKIVLNARSEKRDVHWHNPNVPRMKTSRKRTSEWYEWSLMKISGRLHLNHPRICKHDFHAKHEIHPFRRACVLSVEIIRRLRGRFSPAFVVLEMWIGIKHDSGGGIHSSGAYMYTEIEVSNIHSFVITTERW